MSGSPALDFWLPKRPGSGVRRDCRRGFRSAGIDSGSGSGMGPGLGSGNGSRVGSGRNSDGTIYSRAEQAGR